MSSLKKVLGILIVLLGCSFIFGGITIFVMYLEIADANSREFIPSILFCLSFILMGGILDWYGYRFIKKNKVTIKKEQVWPSEVLDDFSYVQYIKHEKQELLNLYTVLIDARGYGWDDMKSWADYMYINDIKKLKSVQISELHTKPKELLDKKIKKVSELKDLNIEHNSLSIAGDSTTLREFVQISWFNQTRIMKILTKSDDLELMKRYAETVIRRTFNTKDAMKLAKVSEEKRIHKIKSNTTQTIKIIKNYDYDHVRDIVLQLSKIGINVDKVKTNGDDSIHHYQFGFKKEYNTFNEFSNEVMHDYEQLRQSNTPDCDWGSTLIQCSGSLDLKMIIFNDDQYHIPKELTYSIDYTKEQLKTMLMAVEIFNQYDANKVSLNKSILNFNAPHLDYFKRRNYYRYASCYFSEELDEIHKLYLNMDKVLSKVFDISSIQQNFDELKATINKDKSMQSIASQRSILQNVFETYLYNEKEEKLIKSVEMASVEDLIKNWYIIDRWIEGFNARSLSIYIHSKILLKLKDENIEPVKIVDQNIYLDSNAYIKYLFAKSINYKEEYKHVAAIRLSEPEPILCLYDEGIQVHEYKLQTKGDENFKDKYFLICVRLNPFAKLNVILSQIDGVISDTCEERVFTADDIGYRMEGYILNRGGTVKDKMLSSIKGADLDAKGLSYPGYITPSNVRLIGICPKCKKSFTFTSFFFRHSLSEVAYSDDGLDLCVLKDYDIDKDNFSFEIDGKTFRYYNSFSCPHCLESYIDYKNHRDWKKHGVLGCVHLGKTYIEVVNNKKED